MIWLPSTKNPILKYFFWFLSYLSEIIWWFLFFGFVHLSSAFSRLKSKSDVMGRLGWAGCSLSSPSLPQKRVIYWTWTKNTIEFWRFQLLFGYFFHRCIYVTKEVSCIAEQFEGKVTQPFHKLIIAPLYYLFLEILLLLIDVAFPGTVLIFP